VDPRTVTIGEDGDPGPLVPERGNGQVVLAWCHGGLVEGAWAMSMMGLVNADAHGPQRVCRFIGVESSPRVPQTRNLMVRQFLTDEDRPEWLLMIDTDMVFAPEAAEALIETAEHVGAGVAGALCFAGGRGSPPYPTIYVVAEAEPNVVVERVDDYPRGSIVSCDATGAGFLLIHRDVCETILNLFSRRWAPDPWFLQGLGTLDGAEIGEDISFCLRARNLGWKVVVHTGIEVGHMKRHILDEPWYDFVRTHPTEEQGPLPLTADPKGFLARTGRRLEEP
jgi:hypothetical protein